MNGVWQYIPRRRRWYERAMDAVRDIPYLATDIISADDGWRARAFMALILVGFAVAGAIWLIGWALRGWGVR